MKIKTADGQWYICEIRGACFITWVSKKDKERAAVFPANKVADWIRLLSDWTGLSLDADVID